METKMITKQQIATINQLTNRLRLDEDYQIVISPYDTTQKEAQEYIRYLVNACSIGVHAAYDEYIARTEFGCTCEHYRKEIGL